jgi:hypothetical protein
MNDAPPSLASALSELRAAIQDDEEFHYALAFVLSARLRSVGQYAVVVGGQAAAHWLRIAGSRDADLVVGDFDAVVEILTAAGFEREDLGFRFFHEPTDALVELFERPLETGSVRPTDEELAQVMPGDLSNEVAERLLAGSAAVLDPTTVFLAYADAAQPGADFHDPADGGSLAADRVRALVALYRDHIRDGLNALVKAGRLDGSTRDELANLLSGA